MKRTLFLATALAVIGTAPALANDSYPEYRVEGDKDRMVIGVYEQDKNKTLFESLDENGNGQITFPEFQENTQHDNEYAVFSMFDTNEDEIITQAELDANTKRGGDKVNSNNRHTSTNLKTKSGRPASVAPNGFYEPAGERSYPQTATFTRMDDNRNGYVSRTEFYKHANYENEPAVFTMYDSNRDGVLTRAEVKEGSNKTYTTIR